jgi:hypothetical protein
MKKESAKKAGFFIKAPVDLRDRLKRIAENERRSLSAQSTFFIEEAVKRAEEMAGLNEASR